MLAARRLERPPLGGLRLDHLSLSSRSKWEGQLHRFSNFATACVFGGDDPLEGTPTP